MLFNGFLSSTRLDGNVLCLELLFSIDDHPTMSGVERLDRECFQSLEDLQMSKHVSIPK